ncbi:flagellin lysine-N-methylase [Sporomusa sphaeroides]|uniref:flagellin lysine-N-methylase n=1 Tax=Sporomusa sphaeroides TaxID=47679 RepID=UPI002C6D12B2|nr:flagellin lysine-N-methylase [Sporomusa sphaeroides]HML33049.1 flagellin lysine-N-methylase [Sporomusa sphaeroides]
MFIYTDIVAQFSCQMCGACCRNQWQVTLSETSYRRNEALFAGTGRQAEFDQAFIRLQEPAGYGEYAYIAKQAGGGCWFLDTGNRCRLHREAGHSQLDAVCQTFPRYPMSTARGIELTLSFSCPAVLKLADREAALSIVKAEKQPTAVADDSYAVAVYPVQQPARKPLHYYFELETHFIDILQYRGLPLSERLDFLADTVNAVNGLAQDETIGRALTTLFRSNYDYLDRLAVARTPSVTAPGAGLLENFLVSFVFKKPFYIYGLDKTLHLLQRMWQQIVNADDMTAAIRKLEFQYGHDRKVLLD